jgi:hypothetical protein
LFNNKIFDYVIILSDKNGVGTIESVVAIWRLISCYVSF